MIVLEGQTLIDIAIQECGSAEAVVGLAQMNGISVTDELIAGQIIEIHSIDDKTIHSYYKSKSIKPATKHDESITEIPRVWFEELPIEFI